MPKGAWITPRNAGIASQSLWQGGGNVKVRAQRRAPATHLQRTAEQQRLAPC